MHVDMVIPLVASFIDRATRHVDQASMTRLHTTYFDVVSPLTGSKSLERTDDVQIGELQQNIKEFKACECHVG